MLNEIIKIDLHIHSKASDYKDDKIVENSTVENIDTLLKKLNSNYISMFAFTDHNRFDYALYLKAKEIVDEGKEYPNIKKVLPGVEFDVKFNEETDRCHIVVIFNDNDLEKMEKISNVLEENKLVNKEDFYTANEFESILKEIEADSILIAHQKTSISELKKSTNSLSDSLPDTAEFSKIIKVGYINALEFGKPKKEGIVFDSLQKVDIEVPLISGSDCHEWSEYPAHSKSQPSIPHITEYKCLPTFKGLLFAITSFKTRLNRIEKDYDYIKSIKINQEQIVDEEVVIMEKEIPLSKNINVIIGDNGTGKSFLFSKLLGKDLSIYKEFSKGNSITIDYGNINLKTDVFSIEQGYVVDAVRKGKLFQNSDSSYYEDISHLNFENELDSWGRRFYDYMNSKIRNKIKESKTNDLVYQVKSDFNVPYRMVTIDDLNNDEENFHQKRLDSLKPNFLQLSKEFKENEEYYTKHGLNTLTKNIMDNYDVLIKDINSFNKVFDRKSKIKGFISKTFSDFELKVKDKANAQDKIIRETEATNQKFKTNILETIKNRRYPKAFPIFPKIIEGQSANPLKGYIFTKSAKYNNLNLEPEMYLFFFNEGVDEAKLKEIDNITDLVKLSRGLGNDKSTLIEFSTWLNDKLLKFKEKYKDEETYINDITSNNSIGATPGEVSLVYYRFELKDNNKKVIIIDQPEDDINPLKINEFLTSYFNEVRDKMQIIFITHNPALVVNLDVDNVISIDKKKGKIEVFSGCLEYDEEDSEGNTKSIIKEIETNLDGGIDVIEKRLKLYGKNN